MTMPGLLKALETEERKLRYVRKGRNEDFSDLLHWEKVMVEERIVTQQNWGSEGLFGTIFAVIGYFSSLFYLALHKFGLSGDVPPKTSILYPSCPSPRCTLAATPSLAPRARSWPRTSLPPTILCQFAFAISLELLTDAYHR